MKNMSEILKIAGQSNISTMFSSKLARSVVHELEAQWFMKNKLKCEKLSETEDKGLKVMTSHGDKGYIVQGYDITWIFGSLGQ
jgi:hypothetical protein